MPHVRSAQVPSPTKWSMIVKHGQEATEGGGRVLPGRIDGLLIISRPTRQDERGFFRESLRLDELDNARGVSTKFVQENHSHSRRGVLRGLHSENWEKLVYVPRGEVLTAVADVRPA